MATSDQPIRIGQILVDQGVLSAAQVRVILDEQRHTGVPFGVLAERHFEVTVQTIERAWITQYQQFTGGQIDLATQQIDTDVLALINRRQAWQFEILPLCYQPTGELLMAASRRRLARAVTFVAAKLKPVVFFRIAESDQLRRFLQRHYPMPQIADELFRRARALDYHQKVG